MIKFLLIGFFANLAFFSEIFAMHKPIKKKSSLSLFKKKDIEIEKEPLLKGEFADEINRYDQQVKKYFEGYAIEEELKKLEEKLETVQISLNNVMQNNELKSYAERKDLVDSKSVITRKDIDGMGFLTESRLNELLIQYPKISEIEDVIKKLLDTYHKKNFVEVEKALLKLNELIKKKE